MCPQRPAERGRRKEGDSSAGRLGQQLGLQLEGSKGSVPGSPGTWEVRTASEIGGNQDLGFKSVPAL